MRKLRALWSRLRGLADSNHAHEEMDAELSSHVQMHIDDNLRAGMTPLEARRKALIELGGMEKTRQAYREQRSLPIMDNIERELLPHRPYR